MAAGRPIHTADLVILLHNFIRQTLDLAPIPADVQIPLQDPARQQGGSSKGKSDGEKSGGGGGGMGGGGMDGGMGMGGGGRQDPDET